MMDVDAYNDRVEGLRDGEYPMLRDSVYLDHAGSTLCARSLMDRFSADMMSNLLGNPHSGSASSQLTTTRIEDIRLRLLDFFNADPAHFDVVFVANATAAVKLVVEAFRALPDGFHYGYHQASHTSLIGIREEARQSWCAGDEQMESWLSGSWPHLDAEDEATSLLFSYTAQSHMDGRRYPLSWAHDMRRTMSNSCRQAYTLLDAASLVATSPLDLSDAISAPDFTVLSLYKIFGFPDLGALIIRREAEPVFRYKKYFGGGTVDTVICGKEQWHASKSRFLHERLEDGSLPFHNILALDAAFDTHQELFGSMAHVSAHSRYLACLMATGLANLRHSNGRSTCIMYSQQHEETMGRANVTYGPVVCFNIQNAAGAWVSPSDIEKLATLKNFHIRTGGVCSPGGIAATLHLQPWEIRKNFSAGFRCGTDEDIVAGKPTGIIRVSLGAMSTRSDVENFIAFIDEYYREQEVSELPSRAVKDSVKHPSARLHVRELVVYPIKSCSGYTVPAGMAWEVKPEGLAWDREWCLVHQGTGQALSQKRYPKMALIRPTIDFAAGVLRVRYHGSNLDGSISREITIPLSARPHSGNMGVSPDSLTSRVCGDDILAQTCTATRVNEFFSSMLGVSCVLARFPAGGSGRSMRHAKAVMQKHQKQALSMPGTFPDLPSPPDSDSEQQQQSKILLANESPILLLNSASIDALNMNLLNSGTGPVTQAPFRGNIIIGPTDVKDVSSELAFAEDGWTSVRIGAQEFKPMGSCRRCHMICIDQETGERRQEPFLTLAKTRRFDGKVYFGTHMRHVSHKGAETVETQFPTIRVGDVVDVE